jgi:hypothetical protein
MSSVSFCYHLTFGWIPFWGDWLRRVDWTLALMTAPVFLNYFFMHKYSYNKVVLNFWSLLIVVLGVDIFMKTSLTYAIAISAYIFLLFFTRERHVSKLPTRQVAAFCFLAVLGVIFFYLADVTIYWIFHTYWHILIFFGTYVFLCFGSLDDVEQEEKRAKNRPTRSPPVNSDAKVFVVSAASAECLFV